MRCSSNAHVFRHEIAVKLMSGLKQAMDSDITDEKSPNRSRYSNTWLHQLACRKKQLNFRETTQSDFWQKQLFL